MSPGFRRLRAAVQRSGSARVQRGVTLLELMVTLAIVTIVTTIAVPSFQSVIRNNRAATLSNDLLSALNLARSESVTRGKRVTVCKSNDIADDTPTCVTAASWEDGWLIFVDDSGTAGTFDGTDTALRVGQPSSGNATITPTNFTNAVSYLPSGRTENGSGTFEIDASTKMRCLRINNTGRAGVEDGACS